MISKLVVEFLIGGIGVLVLKFVERNGLIAGYVIYRLFIVLKKIKIAIFHNYVNQT